ncbi:MAG TPA: fibronectin type III domain-containing protein, partial [Bacteriovoracaceae bacterium]|nr:fibronectin type III domain-containing protein [Bacteriovoracaceae bacterium]
MSLSWNNVTGADTYKIFKGTATGVLSLVASGLTSTSYVDNAVTDGQSYFYTVQAFNGFNSPMSIEVSARSISAFNMTAVTATVANQLNVTWPTTTGATSYDVRYGTNPTALNLVAANVSSPRVITGLTGGTTYYFRVVAKNIIGDGTEQLSTNQLSAMVISPLGTPTLTATGTPGQVVLNWNSISGASSYEVFKSTISGALTSLQTGIVGTTYTDNVVTNGTIYYYSVRAFNGLNGAPSTEVAVKTIQSFAITSVTSPSPSSLLVTWPASLGADTYDVKYRTGAGAYVTVAGVSSPYTINSLAGTTVYNVAVVGKNAVGASTSFQTPDVAKQTAPVAPATLTATASPGQVNLAWSAVSGAVSYNLYRSATTGGPYTLLASGITALTSVDASTLNGTSYFYVVRTVNGEESPNSVERSARPIAAFTVTSATTVNASKINVVWPAVTGASTYDVRYRIGAGAYTTIASQTSPYEITGLAANTTYGVSIVARNAEGAGASQASNELTAKTSPSAPVGVVATTTTGQISLSWTATSGATSYKIFKGTVSGSLSEIASGNVPTTYADNSVVGGTQYYYAIVAFNGTNSALSSEVTGLPIGSFTITSVTALDTSRLQVNWSPVTGATTYDVLYRSTGATTTISGVTSPRILTGLLAGTTYYVSIRARNSVGSTTSTSTAEVSQITPIGPPTISLVSAPGQVTVSWAAISGATSYKVSRGTSAGVYDTFYNGVTGTSYVDNTGVINGTTYFYSVQSFNGALSPASNEPSITPIASFLITATSATASSVTTTWDSTALGATSYDIQYRTGAAAFNTIAAVTSPRTLTGLLPGTTYDIQVVGKNSTGTTASTYTTAVSSQLTAVGAPTGLVASSSASGQIGLNWTAVTGATSYKVFRSTTSGTFNYATPVTTVAGTAFLDIGLVNGTTYYYVVRSNNGTDSVSSSEVNKAPIANFTFSSLTAASSTSLNLTWTAATGAATYKVVYGLSSGSTTFSVSGLTGTSYTLGSLSANTQYFVKIVAENATAATNTSSELNATTATSAPVGLTATATTAAAQTGRITLNWTATTGAANYNIYKSTTANTYGVATATAVTGTSWVDTAVTDGTPYYYKITASNGSESA